MDRPTLIRTGKGPREIQKLSRFDRSMSLPISNSPLSYSGIDAENFSLSIDSAMEGSNSSSGTNTNLASPLRKMDFALCKNFCFYFFFDF